MLSPLFSSNARIVDCFAPLARYGNNRYRGASLPSLAPSHWSLQMTIANRDACDMRDILIDPISQAQRVCVCRLLALYTFYRLATQAYSGHLGLCATYLSVLHLAGGGG